MEKMFYKCEKIESLDLGNFETKNVKTMDLMFSSCSSLAYLDIEQFNVDNCGSNYLTMFDNLGESAIVKINKDNEKIISLLNDKNITFE